MQQVASYRASQINPSSNSNSSKSKNNNSSNGQTSVYADAKDDQLVDLLFQMLIANPNERVTPDVALNHAYFS